MGRHATLPSFVPPRRNAITRLREDASDQHLQPTCCNEHQQNPPIPERCAYASRPSLPSPSVHQHACAGFGTEPSPRAPNSRERHLRPRVTTWLAPRSPAVVCSRLFPLGAAPISGDGTYPWRSRPRSRSNDLTTDTPCHASELFGFRRVDLRRQGPFPHTAHQPPWLSRPGVTYTDGSHPSHPLLALRVRLKGRHCCLGFAASAQLPITLSPALQQARSNRLAGYSPERLGRVSSIDFCNCMNSQARPRLPKPRRMNTVASHRAVGGVVLARRHQLSLYSSGIARPMKRLAMTVATSVASPRVFPNLSYLRHSLSLPSTRRRLEQATMGDQTEPDARRRRAWPLPAS